MTANLLQSRKRLTQSASYWPDIQSGLGPNRIILIREFWIKIFFLFTWANHFIFVSDSLWFAIQIDFIHFDSAWFDSSLITLHPRIMIHVRIKIKSNQKSKVGESWLTHLRIMGWFDFGSKANQSESQIKLVWALVTIELP